MARCHEWTALTDKNWNDMDVELIDFAGVVRSGNVAVRARRNVDDDLSSCFYDGGISGERWGENRVSCTYACGEIAQTAIKGRHLVPERCVSRVRHDIDLSVRNPRLVPIDDGQFDNRVISAMR
jgi:hypothetical protein